MENKMFKGVLIEKDESGYRAAIKEIDETQLPEGKTTPLATMPVPDVPDTSTLRLR